MPAYRDAESFPRPKGTMTINEIHDYTGLAVSTIKLYIKQGKLGGILRRWRYGVYKRHAWFIPVDEVKRFLAKRAVDKYMRNGEAVEWHPPRPEHL
jgi:hypothetical protein